MLFSLGGLGVEIVSLAGKRKHNERGETTLKAEKREKVRENGNFRLKMDENSQFSHFFVVFLLLGRL